MDTKIKEAWVKKLRSGEIKQTTNILKDSYGMCCLGVLCRVLLEEFPEKANTDQYSIQEADHEIVITYGGREDFWRGDFPSVMAHDLIGERGTNPLINMNDNQGKSFNEIADYIEREL